jgi:hypothetical protein
LEGNFCPSLPPICCGVVTCWILESCWPKSTPPWTYHSWPKKKKSSIVDNIKKKTPHANIFFLVCGLRLTFFVFMPRSVSVSDFYFQNAY